MKLPVVTADDFHNSSYVVVVLVTADGGRGMCPGSGSGDDGACQGCFATSKQFASDLPVLVTTRVSQTPLTAEQDTDTLRDPAIYETT